MKVFVIDTFAAIIPCKNWQSNHEVIHSTLHPQGNWFPSSLQAVPVAGEGDYFTTLSALAGAGRALTPHGLALDEQRKRPCFGSTLTFLSSQLPFWVRRCTL